MAINFRYVHVPRPDGTLRKAPFIPIHVRNKEGRVIELIALLDSGADQTVISNDLAEFLGLKQHKTPEGKTGGIGGKVKVNASALSLQLKGEHESHNLTIPVLVLQEDYEDVPPLLGRAGFFENFEITFKQAQERITLKKIIPKKS